MAWMNLISALFGVALLGFGVRVLVTGRMRGRTATSFDRAGDAGRCYLGSGLFFLLQVAGYLGVRAGLFGGEVRGAFLLLAFLVGGYVLLRHGPRRRTPGL